MSPRTSVACIRAASVAVVLAIGASGCIPDELDVARDASVPKTDGATDGPTDAARDSDATGNDAPAEIGSETGLVPDCRAYCNDVCMGAQPNTDCDKCITNTCEAQNKRLYAAPNLAALDECDYKCADYECHLGCCKGREQACDAYWLVSACTCGFFTTPCKPRCTELCAGQAPSTDCEDCVKDNGCGVAWFDWRYHATTANYLSCLACPDAGCTSTCCANFAASCALLDTFRACVCSGS